jgi:hypothetical protein
LKYILPLKVTSLKRLEQVVLVSPLSIPQLVEVLFSRRVLSQLNSERMASLSATASLEKSESSMAKDIFLRRHSLETSLL